MTEPAYVYRIRGTNGLKAAALRAEDWGYPRPVDPRDGDAWYGLEVPEPNVPQGYALDYRKVAVVWMKALPYGLEGFTPDAWAVHAVKDPAWEGELGSARWLHALEVLAEIEGARALYSITKLGPQFELECHRRQVRYLRIRGWEEWSHPSGMAGNRKLLGGV